MSLKEVSMPNHLVMKALNLNGLAMRKEYLDQYLSDNNLALVFYSLGEK